MSLVLVDAFSCLYVVRTRASWGRALAHACVPQVLSGAPTRAIRARIRASLLLCPTRAKAVLVVLGGLYTTSLLSLEAGLFLNLLTRFFAALPAILAALSAAREAFPAEQPIVVKSFARLEPSPPPMPLLCRSTSWRAMLVKATIVLLWRCERRQMLSRGGGRMF